MTHDDIVDNLLAGYHTGGLAGRPLSRDFLQETLRFVARYAKLERLLFGGTRVAYSSAALGIDLSIDGDLLRQGENLADAERARLGLASGPILELGWLVEDQGIKIIPRNFPEGVAARGGFFFDSELGPCILSDAGATVVQRDYVIAHQYGHFLADYDPYITTLCGLPTPQTLSDPREVRAHSFALAFLAPRRDLETYRTALRLGPGAEINADFVRQLQIYFALDYETVFWRLLSLGWVDSQQVETLLRANPDFTRAVDVDRMDADERLSFLDLPERFVHLVASGFGRGLLELEDAAEYLDTDVAGARRVLDQFHYEDRTPPESPARSTEEREPDRPSTN